MSEIKITIEEIEEIVKEANKKLFEDSFTGMTYPYYGDEQQAARKEKLGSYEKYINTCLQSLKMMVEQVNSNYVNNNLKDADVQFLISDQLGRLQTAVEYTMAALQAIVKNNGQKLHGAGPQFPAMMEEKKKK